MKTSTFVFAGIVSIFMIGCDEMNRPNREGAVNKVNAFLAKYSLPAFGSNYIPNVPVKTLQDIPYKGEFLDLHSRYGCEQDKYTFQELPLRQKLRHYDRALLCFEQYENRLIQVFFYKILPRKTDDEDTFNECNAVEEHLKTEQLSTEWGPGDEYYYIGIDIRANRSCFSEGESLLLQLWDRTLEDTIQHDNTRGVRLPSL